MTRVAKSAVFSAAVPNRWRPARVDGRSVGSLHEFIRQELIAHEGVCLRSQLLEAILGHPDASERLKRSKGFAAILGNMKSSGFIELDNDIVRATARRVGRRHL